MNLAFLGDALDHWKGSLFESMRQAGVLKDFAVDPMASDLVAWQAADFSLFARLLRIDAYQIIRHDCGLGDRVRYFAEIRHSGDLFLDPDTGVLTGRRPSKRHVGPSEISSLISDSDRLVAVYQHVRAQRVCDRVNDVRRALQAAMACCHWCSYESATVAMLFVARNAERTSAVAEHFGTLLGRHAVKRIRSSTDGREV